ncbi:hypothetical protein C8A01DRAFT_18057 [Parachaetomium inaequale]|uniref:Zn(2)-C6 fungal-type domain-containing protein n=1 Tax=Parachaetomium inaequale TaxID=2588326 RepID=A0AAN6PB95_9PEZI|nr:hypothetical protein C8A01DRAFT_18057 [Parachaetomium inaequale]
MEATVIRRRRRPALSCRECRRRKIRCDHSSPCAHCVRHKTQCVYRPFAYDETAVRPGDGPGSPLTATTASPPPLRASSPPQLQPLGTAAVGRVTATQSISVPGSVNNYALEQPAPPLVPDQGGQGPGQRAPTQATLCDIVRRIRELEKSSASRAETSDSPTLNAVSEVSRDRRSVAPQQPPPGTQEWQPVLNKPRDWGRTRWLGGATEFAAIMRCYAGILGRPGREGKNASFQTPEAATLVSQAADSLQGCKNKAKGIKIARPTRGLPSPYAFLAPPSPEIAMEMAELYFENFESAHRILHAPTFWAEYHRYWDHPASITEDVRHMILLVIGIGSSLYDHRDLAAMQLNTESVHQWIYTAETWLSGPLEKDRLDVAGLQIHCLAMLARQIFSIGGDTVWVSMGSLLHGAMQIGLHRDPKHLPAMPVLQAELRRRLWATILDLLVQSSLAAWMPPRISVDEFDTEPPSNVNDDEISESTTVLQPHPKDTFTSTSIQLALLDSLPTRLRIVQFLNSLNSDRSYHRALALTAELTSTINANATLFASSNSPKPSGTFFHRNLMEYLTRRFLIPLHFPFSHQARTNPLFHYSLKISLDAALAIISPELDQPDDDDDDANAKFTRLMSLAGGMFRDGMRCATAAISLELLAHVETQRRDGSLHRTSHCRDTLKRVVRGLVALAEGRIRKGETNVKGHMFMSMVLAQVAAIEKGEEVEVAVARAARDSLAFSERLLGGRTVGEEGFGALGVDGMQGFDFDGFGEELAWESFFPDGRVCL